MKSTFLLCLVLFGFGNNFKAQGTTASPEHIAYLKDFEKNENGEIQLQTFGEHTYWITSIFGSGTKQLYFWQNNNNVFIAKFIVEYGGIDWDNDLNYTFIDLTTEQTITGSNLDEEAVLELLNKFITKSLQH